MWVVTLTLPTEEFKEWLCETLNESGKISDFSVYELSIAEGTKLMVYLEFKMMMAWYAVGWLLNLFKEEGWKSQGGISYYHIRSLYSSRYVDAIPDKKLLYRHVKHSN